MILDQKYAKKHADDEALGAVGAVSTGAIAVGEHFLVYVAVSAVAANAVAGASYSDAACAVTVSQTCPGSSPE